MRLERREAATQPWVGAVLDVPSDQESGGAGEPDLGEDVANAAFAGLHGALTQAGVAVVGPWWTTLLVSEDGRWVQLILCWPVAELPGQGFTVPGLRVAAGVLPERTEALVQVLFDEDGTDGGEQAMVGVPTAAAVHLEEQLAEDDAAADGQVRQVGLLVDGIPVGVELVVTMNVRSECAGGDSSSR